MPVFDASYSRRQWRWGPLLSIMLMTTLGTSACGLFAPSRPWEAGYVIKENGALVAKLVCGEFSSVQVRNTDDSGSTVLWSAQSTDLGTDNLPLLEAEVEGYAVESKGALDWDEVALVTFERTDGVLGGSVEFVASSLGEDEVAFAGGVVMKTEFDRMSRGDFGCM